MLCLNIKLISKNLLFNIDITLLCDNLLLFFNKLSAAGIYLLRLKPIRYYKHLC